MACVLLGGLKELLGSRDDDDDDKLGAGLGLPLRRWRPQRLPPARARAPGLAWPVPAAAVVA